jgi:hypothetical protein
MFRRRLAALLAAISIAIGVAGIPHATEAEAYASPPGIDCERECTWT